MLNLWIYRRRPSCIVRYRHGGQAAIFPPALQQETVVIRGAARAVVTAEGAARSQPVRHQESNILPFPVAPKRGGRSMKSRPNGRAKGKAPKKRD